MKCHKKLIVFILILVFMTTGCAATKICKPTCPSEDAYFLVGPGIPIHVPKGFFDNPKDWATKEEMRKIIDKIRAKKRGI